MFFGDVFQVFSPAGLGEACLVHQGEFCIGFFKFYAGGVDDVPPEAAFDGAVWVHG